jgi:hypothetical protein
VGDLEVALAAPSVLPCHDPEVAESVIDSRTSILQVRIRLSGGDEASARLHADRILRVTPLTPSGLSPSAVLCVRRIDDPSPRTLRLDAWTIRPPPEWERAATGELDSALRSAARPAQGMVPVTANAVYFADQGEVLACLARDWLAGTAVTRWWWRGLGLATSPPGAVGTAFERSPRYVPRALVLLAEWSWAVPLVQALEPAEAARMALAVGTEFGLPAVVRAARRLQARPALSAVLAVDHRVSRSHAHAPWREVVPEADALGDQPARELLLGTGLAIERMPVTVRSAAFGKAVGVWVASVVTANSPTRVAQPFAQPNVAAVGHPSPEATPPADGTTDKHRPRIVRDGATTQKRAPRLRRSGERAMDRHAVPPGADVRALEPVKPTPPHHDRGVQPGQRSIPADTADVARGSPAIDLSAKPIETRLGGVFYLLNLALYLGLYGDFTQPEEPGIELDPWDLVNLLAARLGGGDESEPDDLWPLLAALAIREQGQRPGRDFHPPREWRIPPEWLDPFREDTWLEPWRWSSAGGRILVEHPAGFPVLDIPSQGRPSRRRVAAALRRYGRIVPLRRTALPGPQRDRRPLARWLTRLGNYARARLAVALSCAPDAVSDVLFRHDARVVVTPTTVDVAMSLADLPISIRFAGLDRDPGWIPAARRAVRFHFE